MRHPAVFLDRDNTIIKNDGDLGDPDAVELITGVPLAIASLCGLGYRVVVVTNQGGVARGAYTEKDVEAVHERIRAEVEERANGARIDAFYACPFHPEGTVKAYTKDHKNRKPKPGMLLQAAEELNLDLSASWMVGDQERDVAAGAAAGCRTILLNDAGGAKPRKAAGTKRRAKAAEPDDVAPTLVEAVRIIASKRKPEVNEAMARSGGRTAGKRFDKQAMAELQKPICAGEREERGGKPVIKGSDRPFVPWTQARPEPDAASAEGRAAPSVATEPGVAGATLPQAVAEPAVPTVDETKAVPRERPALGAGTSGRTRRPDTARDVRLILKELRMQRGSSDELPQLNVVAISLQGLTGLCLLGALWLGAGNDNFYTFFRWITVTLVLQVAVVATLLFGRR